MDKINKYYTQRDLEIVIKHLNRGKVLDVGGGKGRLAIPLAKRGYKVTLVDADGKNIEKAKEKASNEDVDVKAKAGDIKELEFEDGSFNNVIAMRDVLNCCGDEYEKAFSEISRVCKESGKIIISCGSKYGYLLKNTDLNHLYEVIVEDKIFESKEGFPFKAFTLKELEKLFTKFNITLVEKTGDSIIMQVLKEQEIEDLKKVREIDKKLSQRKGMLEFFDHLILAGRKEKYINF